MLLNYIQAAMNHAEYEILEEENAYYGAIPICPGVYATASSLESCRTELREVLEEWILFRVHRNLELPEIDGLSLKIEQVA